MARFRLGGMEIMVNVKPGPDRRGGRAARSEPVIMHHGMIEMVEKRTVRGWAVDLTQAGRPASLILVADGRPLGMIECNEPRPDVNALGLPGMSIGFVFDLPEMLLDGKSHRIALRFRDGDALPLIGADVETDGGFAYRYRPTTVYGHVDGMFGSSVRGWAFRLDERSDERVGKVDIEVRSNGVKIDQISAGLIRNDVAEAHGCEPQCGFLYSVPTRFRSGQPFILEFSAVPEGTSLVGSPFTGSTLVRSSVEQLHAMHARVEALCTEMYALKDQLRNMTTSDDHTINLYGSWAQQYFACLTARVVEARRMPRYGQLMSGARPKVSVICPTYRPNLADFRAAIESVRRQSWTDWELIIVDDGSDSAELTAAIHGMCADDHRILARPQPHNGGISAATNAAMDAATGDYIAFFDHDDLLVEEALEVMMIAARDTGAKVLYSDEDKIDRFGNYSEPHLKSDWNYRMLLACNYVCHLLVVEAESLRAVGHLRAAYDGAQDHDLILRLSEAVEPARVHHVAEVLYHWRKTDNSTASQQSSKSYAVEAGRKAVTDHLARTGLSATVSAPFDTTLFDVRWAFKEEPRVSILIPFKDQSVTTRRCVTCILDQTAYDNYEIVLIDNWSNNPDTSEWLDGLRGHPRVRIVRVEERFNYSRLNNQAARLLNTDYLLFMNNDIFVAQRDWLRLMVDEALADPNVGIVGVKLLYPNGTVQHGGVVLGVGGVADHVFRYHPANQAGYSFRAIIPQDMSAVTAACMLCRSDAFHEVGMFDEARLSVAFNDVDLCLKVGQAGYRIVFTPAVVAEHHESLSRGSDLAEHNLARFYEENQVMMDRWGPLIRRDPFYNIHFSCESGVFENLSNASLDPRRAPGMFVELPRRQFRPRFIRPALTPAPAPARSRRTGQKRVPVVAH